MKKTLQLPAWLFAAGIFAQLLLVSLCVHQIWIQKHQPKSWSLDSTTYYKFLEGQGKLNLKLYEQQQSHAARLQNLDKKRQARHAHIDSLSGDALQREIDRQYNSRQPQNSAGPKDRPEADPVNRSGGASGTEGQSRSDHASRRGAIPGYTTEATTAGHFNAEPNDSAVKRAAAAGKEPGHECPVPGRRLPEETARSQTGELASARSRPVVHRGETETHLSYWRLIRSQGYTYPDIAFAISAVETGYWWSPAKLAEHGNNLFGFKKNGRGFYVSVSATGYCRYKNQMASLADYGAYEKQVIAKYNLRSRADYLSHIHRRYCPSPSYRGKLHLAFQEYYFIKALA